MEGTPEHAYRRIVHSKHFVVLSFRCETEFWTSLIDTFLRRPGCPFHITRSATSGESRRNGTINPT